MPSPFLGHLRRVHPRPVADLFQAGALRYRRLRSAGRLCLPAAGARRRAGLFQSDPGYRAAGRRSISECPGLQWLLAHAIFPGVPHSRYLPSPDGRAAWVGHVRHRHEPAAHRPVGWRPHSLLLLSRGGTALISRARLRPDAHSGAGADRALSRRARLPASGMWTGWSVWGLILLWLGRRHPIIHDPSDLDVRAAARSAGSRS